MTVGSGLEVRREYWEARAARCATDAERVDSTPTSQRARFSTVDDLLFPGCSVLDVGCGVGDLFGYLNERPSDRPECEYFGVDLSARMVARAREKYPAGRFEVGGLETLPSRRAFDVVVGIGIHSDLVPDAFALLVATLRLQLATCRVAAHACLLSDRFDGFGPGTQAWSPAEVLSIAQEMTPWVSLRHDYLPHDFSVTLRRGARR